MDFLHKVPTEILYVTIAAAGGTARYLNIYLKEGDFTLRHFVAHVFISAFSGYMFYQAALNLFGMPEGSIAIVSGLGGWMGVEALKWLEMVLKNKMGDKK